MNRLNLHCGASVVDRAAVCAVATPRPEGTHYPIPHQLLLETVEANCRLNGMDIVEESHALQHDGQRYFGMLRICDAMSRRTGGGTGGGTGRSLVIGMRNTHDKAWAAALVLGETVHVCDNLAFSGEAIVGRKHTRNIERDLPLLVPKAFGVLTEHRDFHETRVLAYQGRDIGDAEAHDLIVRSLVDERIFPVSRLPDVVAQWRQPSHEEFSPRNVWSLFNCYTECAKPREGKQAQLAALSQRTRNLYGFLDREVGLVWRTKQEELERAVRDVAMEDVVVRNDAFGRNVG